MQRATRRGVVEAMGAVAFLLLVLAGSVAAQGRLQSSDFRKLRSVGAVQWSPDGTRIAYTITRTDGPGEPYAQLYIGLKDVGVEVAMLRYPREGHGLREPGHIVDSIDRSIGWYERFFPKR